MALLFNGPRKNAYSNNSFDSKEKFQNYIIINAFIYFRLYLNLQFLVSVPLSMGLFMTYNPTIQFRDPIFLIFFTATIIGKEVLLPRDSNQISNSEESMIPIHENL